VKHRARGERFRECSQWSLPFRDQENYFKIMTKLLEKALEAVRRLPPDGQDHIARAMLSLSANGGEPEKIDPADLPAVLEGLAEARRREFATDAEVEAAFRRFER
jgi:DNA-binding TFAR19-related protein (PDSD5 family)